MKKFDQVLELFIYPSQLQLLLLFYEIVVKVTFHHQFISILCLSSIGMITGENNEQEIK